MSRRIIFVTGANGGLGQAIARAFLEESADNVVCLGTRSARDQAEKLAAEFPGRCDLLELEVTQPEAWQSAVAKIVSAHGRLDVLVNNAGQHHDGLLATMPLPAWEHVIAHKPRRVFFTVVRRCCPP